MNNIIDMLAKEKTETVVPETVVPDQTERVSREMNIWADTERMANVKAPAPTSVLVVKKVNDEVKRQENQKVVEDAIMENDVSIRGLR